MDARTLQSWWAHKQGLDGSLEGKDAAHILERSGWARSVGGAAPYLTMWSRGGFSRETMDRAAVESSIHELPAARGCTYVVPACDFAIALKAGAGFSSESEMKVARKLGVTDKEIEKLSEAILKALAKDTLDPGAIRQATGNASRSLGPEGQKKGISTTLPLALGKLQVRGEIRRVPTNGRLDQQRYKYTAWKSPLAKSNLTQDEAFVELARKYFAWIGPASASEFQWFSGLSGKAAKSAIEPLKLSTIDNDKLIFPEDLDSLRAHKVAKDPCYKLTSSLDGMTLLRRNHITLVAPEHLNQNIPLDKGLGSLSGLPDLPSHIIFDRGRIVGVWEFDTQTMEIAWLPFVKRDKALDAAVERTQSFVRDQLGDARSFSLDSPKSRTPKIAAFRVLARLVSSQ